LEKSGGLDGARWFELSDIPELRIYNDIIPLISKAIEIISLGHSQTLGRSPTGELGEAKQ
jgi:hypothetical protein